MSLGRIKLSVHRTSINENGIGKLIIRSIHTFQSKQYKTDKWSTTSSRTSVVKLKPSKLVGVKKIGINVTLGRSHQSGISSYTGLFLEGSTYRLQPQRRVSDIAINQLLLDKANSNNNGLITNNDGQVEKEDEEDSMKNTITGFFIKHCEQRLNNEANKGSTEEQVKIYNEVTTNLDELFPRSEDNDEHPTKIKKASHLQIAPSLKYAFKPVIIEFRPDTEDDNMSPADKLRLAKITSLGEMNQRKLIAMIKIPESAKLISKSRCRRSFFKESPSLPSLSGHNIRLDDIHFSKDLEPKSEIATRLFGQESVQQTTQLHTSLPTPMEFLPKKEEIVEMHIEYPSKRKVSIEEEREVIKKPIKKQRSSLSGTQNIRLDEVHFNKKLEPKTDIAKRLFYQEPPLEPLPAQDKMLPRKKKPLALDTKPPSKEEAKGMENKLQIPNGKAYPGRNQNLSIQSDRIKKKYSLTQILQSLMKLTTSGKSKHPQGVKLKPELQLDRDTDSKESKSEQVMKKLSSSRSSHLTYTQNRKMI